MDILAVFVFTVSKLGFICIYTFAVEKIFIW